MNFPISRTWYFHQLKINVSWCVSRWDFRPHSEEHWPHASWLNFHHYSSRYVGWALCGLGDCRPAFIGRMRKVELPMICGWIITSRCRRRYRRTSSSEHFRNAAYFWNDNTFMLTAQRTTSFGRRRRLQMTVTVTEMWTATGTCSTLIWTRS